MSKFEVISGVEGCCLALDDTRIAGPKPWGGGAVIHVWETDKDYKAVDSYSRWHELFGTPEKTAQTLITVRKECEDIGTCYPNCPFRDAPACPSGVESRDYDALLEWLRSDA